jgi:hypothetical protein
MADESANLCFDKSGAKADDVPQSHANRIFNEMSQRRAAFNVCDQREYFPPPNVPRNGRGNPAAITGTPFYVEAWTWSAALSPEGGRP